MLTQEPWCYTPEQIARLTDWQIEHLYLKPAEKRAREYRDEAAEPQNPSRLETLFAAGVPPWDEFLPAMMAEFPDQTEAHWRSVWDEAKLIEASRRAAADRNAAG